MIQFATEENIRFLNNLTNYKIEINAFNKVLIYVEGEKTLAFLDYSLIYDRMEINYIYVKENYRKQNIAYKLIKYIIDNNKFINITLEVNILNVAAINLYKKLDFQIIGRRPNYYSGIDAYLMERK